MSFTHDGSDRLPARPRHDVPADALYPHRLRAARGNPRAVWDAAVLAALAAHLGGVSRLHVLGGERRARLGLRRANQRRVRLYHGADPRPDHRPRLIARWLATARLGRRLGDG